jgi:probable Rubsico expression protein CbbX
VGQYIGHTAPKTREVLKKAMGGVLFIDEAYYLYRPENERDYGQEAIEILLQVMENQRDDLVVILAGYKDRMDTFFSSNPGMSSRIAHHLDFPDYSAQELLRIADQMLVELNYRFDDGRDGLESARAAFEQYLELRMRQPHFANARSVRNALDRARLRQASRLFAQAEVAHSAEDLSTLNAADLRHPGRHRAGPPGRLQPRLCRGGPGLALGCATLHPAAGGLRRQRAHTRPLDGTGRHAARHW